MSHIPKTIEEAKGELGGIDKLLTAKEWERAAIVYAFTMSEGNPAPLGDEAFASLGITGLKDRGTVRVYRTAWANEVATGKLPAVKPGDEFTIPEGLGWPPTGHTSGSIDQRPVEQQVEAAARILAKPEAQAVLTSNPEKLGMIARSIDEAYEPLEKKAQPTPPAPEWVQVSKLEREVFNHAFKAFWILEQLKDLNVTGDDRERMIFSLESAVKLANKAISLLNEEDVTIDPEDLDDKAAIEEAMRLLAQRR